MAEHEIPSRARYLQSWNAPAQAMYKKVPTEIPAAFFAFIKVRSGIVAAIELDEIKSTVRPSLERIFWSFLKSNFKRR